MITVTAYNPAKSPMAFGSTGKSKKVSPHVSAVKTPVAYKNQSAIQSVRTFFKALPLALGLGAMTPAFNSCDPIDVPDKPVTKLSPTQKQFATIFNTMYGTSSAEQARANGPSKVSAASTSTALPKEFVYDGSVLRTSEIYDYSDPDTTKVTSKVIHIESGASQGTFVDKIYKDADGNLIRKSGPYIGKFTIDPADSKVVETVLTSTSKYKYIPQNDSIVVKKALIENGIEKVLKIVRRVNL